MKHNPCPLCGSTLLDYKFHIEKESLFQCKHCDFIFLDTESPEPRPVSQAPFKKANSKVFLEQILDYSGTKDVKILELCINGSTFTDYSKEKNIQTTLIEMEPTSGILYLQGSKLGSTESIELSTLSQYDIVVLSNLLERVKNPYQFLYKLRSAIKPTGILAIITPSLDSWSAKVQKNRWFEFTKDHISYFTIQNLESILVRAGYHQIDSCLLKSQNIKNFSSEMIVLCKKTSLPQTPELLSIVMPVFNEKNTFEETLNKVIQKQVERMKKEIIIVESNSTDGTKQLVQKYEGREGIRIIYEEKPKGKGHAVRTGLKNITGSIVLIQDADSEYDVDDYDALLDPILNYQKMFVLGSRHTGDWKMRNFENRKFLSAIFNIGQILFTWMVNVFCGSKLKDPFTMYKVFRRECMDGLVFDANRFDFDWEIVIKFLRKKYYPLEIPVNYSSRSYSEGKKVNIIRDPISWMKALIKYRFQELKPKPKNKIY
jgi:hypothetical protein